MTKEELEEAADHAETKMVVECNGNYTKFKKYKDGFRDGLLAGLKEGKPKWHDLRKDPNDLPLKMGIGSEVVLISYDGEVTDFAYYNFEAKRWEHDEDAFYICNPPPIAWCEIPKFEEEE